MEKGIKITIIRFENDLKTDETITYLPNKSFFEEYIALKKLKVSENIFETSNGFYFYNALGTKIEYKFTVNN